MTSQISNHPHDPASDGYPHEVPSLGSVTGRLLLTPEQAADRIGVCRTVMFQLMRTGQVRSVTIGRSRRITPAALVDYVERLVEGSGDDAA